MAYAMKNKVQLIGNLGNTPELKGTESGKPFAAFTLATNESYLNDHGEKVTETQWHKIQTWGKLAEIAAKYLKQGSEVAVEGKLINRTYIDEQGKKHYVTEVIASDLLMLGKHKAPETAKD